MAYILLFHLVQILSIENEENYVQSKKQFKFSVQFLLYNPLTCKSTNMAIQPNYSLSTPSLQTDNKTDSSIRKQAYSERFTEVWTTISWFI